MASQKTIEGEAIPSQRDDSALPALVEPELNEDQLKGITSFADAVSAFGVDSVEEFGDGFEQLDNKDELLDIPFIIVSYKFDVGDMGPYVFIKLVTQHDRKYWITDGSSGIYRQLDERYQARKPIVGLKCMKGLDVSRDYTPKDADGNPRLGDNGLPIKATTYYIKR